jgi:poly-gamma-glutamate synthesis protein (capsule biosynthesis protein)
MLTFNIEKTDDQRAVIAFPQFIPTVCHYPKSFYNNVVYLLEDYTEELASQHAVKTYYNHTISLEKLTKYVTDTIDKEFLPDYLK